MSQDVVAFIDCLMQSIVERPWMYASSPSGIESLIFQLENVRQFAAGKVQPELGMNRYAEYCEKTVGGALSLTWETPQAPREEFAALQMFLRDYLASRGP